METLYTETKALVAALNGDDEEVRNVVGDLTAREARSLLDALEVLADVVEVALYG